jgi:hypothetical protein
VGRVPWRVIDRFLRVIEQVIRIFEDGDGPF